MDLMVLERQKKDGEEERERKTEGRGCADNL